MENRQVVVWRNFKFYVLETALFDFSFILNGFRFRTQETLNDVSVCECCFFF